MKRSCSIGNPYRAQEQKTMFSIDHLNRLRRAEIEFLVSHLFNGARILEIEAGTGQQASDLATRGFNVVAIEKHDSQYACHRVSPIVNYEGRNILFDSHSFDIVFTIGNTRWQ